MCRDPIQAGTSAVLRAVFKDADDNPITTSGITVNLFEPGLDPDEDSATVTGLVPVSLGNGVYEVSFTAGSTGGSWIDQWTGPILGTSTTAELSFSVINTGTISPYPDFGVCPNNLVEIEIDTSVASTEGATLAADYSMYFTTEYTPLYSSVRKVRLDAGGMMGEVSDDTINLAILEASLEADVLTFSNQFNTEIYQHARREYVTCKAAQVIAVNILSNGGLLKSKALSDFRVDYDTDAVMSLLDDMKDKCKKWAAQVQSGGRAREMRDPQFFVKGELDPDRPLVGRTWDTGLREKPVGNSRYRPAGRRRWKTTHTRRNRIKDTDW